MIRLHAEMVEIFVEISKVRDPGEKVVEEGRGDALCLAAVGEEDGHGGGV